MRKTTVLLTAAAISLMAASCVKPDQQSAEHSRRRVNENYAHEMLESGNYRSMPSVSFPYSNESAPEITCITAYCKADEFALRQIDADAMYGIDYYTSQVVGRVGTPVDIDFPDDMQNLFVEFSYDQDELYVVDEGSMSVIYYDEESGFFLDVDTVVDTENDTVAFCPEQPGEYIMINAPSFAEAMLGEYTVDRSGYDSEWERGNDTGDIMEIADISWAEDNAPVFNVSTPAQLAGVVWYTNVYTDIVEINLMNDIDLYGYDWAPMGCYGLNAASFNGTINGNGYSILNMTIDDDSNGSDVGFVGHSTDLTVYNINFLNANISGGEFTGIVGGEVYGTPMISNVCVTGTVSNSGWGEAGTILGRETNAQFEDCTVTVIVNGEPNQYFSNHQQHMAELVVDELFEVSISQDGICTRNRIPDSPDPLSWHIEVNGVCVLERNCVDELSFNLFEFRSPNPGDVYTVYIECHDGEYYVPCSNIAEITVE